MHVCCVIVCMLLSKMYSIHVSTSHSIIRKPLAELVGQDEKDAFRVVSEVSLNNTTQTTMYNSIFGFSTMSENDKDYNCWQSYITVHRLDLLLKLHKITTKNK